MSDDPGEESGRSRSAWAVGMILGLGIVGAVIWLVVRAQSAPGSVRPVIWDKESCEECKMAISQPSFAAQLQTEDGRVLDFDDPGCLVRFQAEERPRVRASYFHALRGEGWLTRDEVAFLPGVRSPMGYDLGAVPRGTPGALSYLEATRKILGGGPGREARR